MSLCIPGCIACRDRLPEGHELHGQRDIVQVQKEVWARIAREEREGKRRRPVVRWSGGGR
jgi:hypothetical protein